MTAASGVGARVAAPALCCIVAALSYSGAVSLFALLAFVLPAVVFVALVTAGVARLSIRLGAASGLVAALGVAEIVNLVSGTAHGPAARSTFAAAAFTVLAVAAVHGPAPALFTVPVVGVVVGALGLGAGAEVAPVAVATAVVTVVALAVVERLDRRWTGRPPQLMTVVAFALLVGALSAAIALRADRQLEGEPAVLAPGAVQPTIRPPEVLGDPGSTVTPTPTPSPTPEADTTAPPPSEPAVPLRTIWLVALVLVLVLILGVAIRILWIAIAWRSLRRRLRRGSEPDQVAGAWVWSTRRLRAGGWPIPLSLSADAVAAVLPELPRPVRSPLRDVAADTVAAVYAPPMETQDPVVAWTAADEVGRGAVRTLPAVRRLAFALRSVNSRPSRPAAPAPATVEESRS